MADPASAPLSWRRRHWNTHLERHALVVPDRAALGAEVENVLAGHPAIAEVGVVGRPHPRWGGTPVAFVVPRDPQHKPSIEELREWASPGWPATSSPPPWRSSTPCPRNASGKVLKPVLRDRPAT